MVILLFYRIVAKRLSAFKRTPVLVNVSTTLPLGAYGRLKVDNTAYSGLCGVASAFLPSESSTLFLQSIVFRSHVALLR